MKKYDFKNLIKSIFFFVSLVFTKKKYDVIFVYINHFNRGIEGQNLFLAPMIQSCKKYNIKYLVFEESDLKGAFSKFPRNKDAIPLDFISLLRIFYCKIYKDKKLVVSKNKYYFQRERIFSTYMKKFLFRNFCFNYCINMAGESLPLFRGLNNDAIIAEYQHGTIYNGHEDYLVNEKVDDYIFKNKANFLVSGKGYKNLLINYDKSNYYNDNTVFDIGINQEIFSKYKSIATDNKLILFTSQLTTDLPYSVMERYIDILNNIFNKNASFLKKNGYKILFKHHPRYNYQKCPAVNFDSSYIEIIDDMNINELLNKVSLHMTFRSTTAFEAGLKGIPTIFINMLDFFSKKDIYFEQYQYPLVNFKIFKSSDLEYILKTIDNKNASLLVQDWAKSFYAPYDEIKFLKFLGKL